MNVRILRLPEVELTSGLKRTRIDELERLGLFPKRRRISKRAVGWLSNEVGEWIAARPCAEDVRPDAAGDPRRRGVGKKKKTAEPATETTIAVKP